MAGLYTASKIKSHPLPECGLLIHSATLSSYYSEEGVAIEYRVENQDHAVVAEICALWESGGHDLIRKIAGSVSVDGPDEDQQEADYAARHGL